MLKSENEWDWFEIWKKLRSSSTATLEGFQVRKFKSILKNGRYFVCHTQNNAISTL